ncbi:MAG: DUF262 domain-containing protein [Planctomycetota bacterium]|nr:MAG: DUF262 domain-containing protein [Planctomycetota bacterium]
MPIKKSPSKSVQAHLATEPQQPFNAGVSIRRVSDLIREVDQGVLILKPAFQRRLVWTNVVKDHFLETVVLGLPFPEIFIATGELDTTTMLRSTLLVDGQQRISTLREYVHGSEDLVLSKVPPYAELTVEQKGRFLDYEVVVRDLGKRTPEQIKEVFARINSTDYALKAIERLNARFSGEYKQFCDTLSKHSFFDKHVTFSLADLRRMRDLDFCVILTTTLLSTYYHRDELNYEYLERFNDSFPKGKKIKSQIEQVFNFIDECGFDKKCRVWKKTDLFTLIVELSTYLKKTDLDAKRVGEVLDAFYREVDERFALRTPVEDTESGKSADRVFRYLKAATKATNDKYARVDRAEVIDSLLDEIVAECTVEAAKDGGKPKRKMQGK